MPGLVPGIHVFLPAGKTWMAGTKPGHDGESVSFNKGEVSIIGIKSGGRLE
jgi:hypothetical protein